MNLQNNSTGKTIVGMLLILFGITLFLSNFDVIRNVRGIIFSWQIILIVVGVLLFVNHKDSGTGLLLLTIGSIGLIAKLNHTSMKFIFMEYWPVLLIVFGIHIIFKKSDIQFTKSKNYFENDEPKMNPDKF